MPNGAGGYHDYYYAADRQRWKQVYNNGTASETTIFVGGILEKHAAGGITEYRHTIHAGEQPVALYTRSISVNTTQYFLLDHLGSVAGITNRLGGLDVAENFAAFGERRDASDWSGPPSAGDQTIINSATQRGYTFHTNSESSSLIHMNGRIADARTGRFLSADPYVFEPQLTQSFNRYSYVNNNPLTYTDPSGFCFEGVTAAFLCRGAIASGLSYIGRKLFGRKKLPPPKGCFVTGGGIACYGKAFATKLYDIARDIYGLPRLGESPVWGVGDGRFGTGPCSWGPGCMSWGDESIWSGSIPTEESAYSEYLFRSVLFGLDSKIALEPLVKGGVLRIEVQDGAVLPSDPRSKSIIELQNDIEATGDTRFASFSEFVIDAGLVAKYGSYGFGGYQMLRGAGAGYAALKDPQVRAAIFKATSACVAAGVVGCTTAGGSAISSELKTFGDAIDGALRQRARLEQIGELGDFETLERARRMSQY